MPPAAYACHRDRRRHKGDRRARWRLGAGAAAVETAPRKDSTGKTATTGMGSTRASRRASLSSSSARDCFSREVSSTASSRVRVAAVSRRRGQRRQEQPAELDAGGGRVGPGVRGGRRAAAS
ncbi:hypothetical protein VPH35_011416 [Triticum aestivum]